MNVEFETYSASRLQQFTPPKIIQWVITYSGGMIKDEQRALYVVLGLSGVMFTLMLILLFSAFGGHTKPPVGYRGNIPDLPEYRNPPTPEELR
jgi:hypothetical protein